MSSHSFYATTFIYNVTIKEESEIAEEWLHWLRHEHIPEVMHTGCFEKKQLVKLLQDDDEDSIYAVQYFAVSLQDYDHYIEHHAPALREKTIDKWGDRFVAFRTLMEVID